MKTSITSLSKNIVDASLETFTEKLELVRVKEALLLPELTFLPIAANICIPELEPFIYNPVLVVPKVLLVKSEPECVFAPEASKLNCVWFAEIAVKSEERV